MAKPWTVGLYAVVLLVGIGGFTVLAVKVCGGADFTFDRRLLRFAAEARNGYLDRLFLLVTWAGSLQLLAPVAAVIIAAQIRARACATAALMAFGFGGAVLLNRLIKYLLGRERPQLFPHLADMVESPAFPSGHATQAAAFSLAVFLLVRRRLPPFVLSTGILLTLMTLLVAISRVYLQVHYPSDVLAGLLLGVIWVTGIHLAIKLYGWQ